jgi:hypothetical protein
MKAASVAIEHRFIVYQPTRCLARHLVIDETEQIVRGGFRRAGKQ